MWRTWITAHSGCEGTPDNSMEYVGLASTLGVDVLEFDVRRSDNGELVMAHDADEIESEQLSEAFEFLVAYPHLRMNCDLKASGLELAVWELACQHKVQQQLVYSGSVDLEVLSKHPWLTEKVGFFLNIEQVVPGLYENLRLHGLNKNLLLDIVPALKKAMNLYKADCLNIHYHLFFPELEARFKQESIPVSVWTPNEPDVIKALLQAGVYNITTRSPRVALILRSELE